MSEEENALVVADYNVQELGGHLYIALPKKWTDNSGIEKGDALTVIANQDVKILSAKSKEALYEKISQFVDRPVKEVKKAMGEKEEAEKR